MPFITNNFQHLVVDDVDFERNPEKYKDYVVARRLLVTSKTSFTVEYLKERFDKYGEIESTKILKSNLEGFVTFSCDRHACLAYDREKDKCADKKVTVDATWHQPDGLIRSDSEWNTYESDADDHSMGLDVSIDETMDSETSPHLLHLDDDCLFALFDRCDNFSLVNLAKTCNRLEKLLKNGNYYFPKHKSFDKEEEDRWPLIDVENVFQLMGRYFEKVSLCFDDVESLETILSYIRSVVNHCNDGKMTNLLFVMFGWKNKVWYELSTVLKNLSTLEVGINDYYNDEEVIADLTELCPNLKTLTLTDMFLVDKSLTRTVPNLKTFVCSDSWNDFVDDSTVFTFFHTNPQLKVFECREFDFDDVALTLLLLPNVETLSLFEVRSLESADDALHLQKFANLRHLTLSFGWSDNINKSKIIDSCGQLKNLSELKLYFCKATDRKEGVVNLPRKLVHLERLELVGVQLDEYAVLNFVRRASKIKAIHFHRCDVYATESLLAQLRVFMGKSSQRYRSDFSLFIGDKRVAVNRREVKSIDWVCKHRIDFFD